MNEYIAVFITVPDIETAEKISKKLVDQRLVACAQIDGPIKSIYCWKNELHTDQEWRVVLKTNNMHFKKIESLVVEMHPYEVPQIIALPFANGYVPYLQWINESLSDQEEFNDQL